MQCEGSILRALCRYDFLVDLLPRQMVDDVVPRCQLQVADGWLNCASEGNPVLPAATEIVAQWRSRTLLCALVGQPSDNLAKVANVVLTSWPFFGSIGTEFCK